MNKLRTFFNGLVIGSSMSIPGISGGTIAMILGVYDRLLSSVSDVFRKPKQSLPFLALMAAGGLLGLFTAAKLLTFLFTTSAEVPLKFAFLGAAAGCIPPMLKSSSVLPLSPKKLLLMISGAAVAAVFASLPTASAANSGLLPQLGAGLLLAAALVLPGVSVSQTLLMLGMYEPVMYSVANGDIIALLPLALGLLVGIFLTAKLLSFLLERFRSAYLTIVGFMIFSLTQLIPQVSGGVELILGLASCAIGLMITLLLNKSEKKHDIVHKTS